MGSGGGGVGMERGAPSTRAVGVNLSALTALASVVRAGALRIISRRG